MNKRKKRKQFIINKTSSRCAFIKSVAHFFLKKQSYFSFDWGQLAYFRRKNIVDIKTADWKRHWRINSVCCTRFLSLPKEVFYIFVKKVKIFEKEWITSFKLLTILFIAIHHSRVHTCQSKINKKVLEISKLYFPSYRLIFFFL